MSGLDAGLLDVLAIGTIVGDHLSNRRERTTRAFVCPEQRGVIPRSRDAREASR
jgi:hypothetical protein